MKSGQKRMCRSMAVTESMMRPSEDALACEFRIVAVLELRARSDCHDDKQLTYEQLHR